MRGTRPNKQAEKRIGHLYPPIEITPELAKDRPDLQGLVGQKLTVIAWLWARTVKSPNPAFSGIHVPLVTTFVLSTRAGQEVYLEPRIHNREYDFVIRQGIAPPHLATGTKAASRGAKFRCILSDAPIELEHIRTEASHGRMCTRLMALVAEGPQGRVFLPADSKMESLALSASPKWQPDLEFAHNSRYMTPWAYGLSNFGSLFSTRQLAVMDIFCSLVSEAQALVAHDAKMFGEQTDLRSLDSGGAGANAYAEAIATYLAFGVSKSSDYWSNLCTWRSDPKNLGVGHVFSRQAIPMVWDFAEANPFSDSSGNWTLNLDWVCKVIMRMNGKLSGFVSQQDARKYDIEKLHFVATDPPYFDNVPYADLSDFFYVWLRKMLRSVFPTLLASIAVPKIEELVATPERQGGKEAAENYFLSGMTETLSHIAEKSFPGFPLSIFYAFKQSDIDGIIGTSSTGWETFLQAIMRAGLLISGTWPVRTELGNRTRSMESNVLASSIVLVCRKRPADAPVISRREFLREVNTVLPEALDEMTKGGGDDQSPIAPVDLSQSIIGPGMAVFSKYAAVLEANGEPMTVRTALQLINRFLAEDDFDHDTQFCLHWFEQYGWEPGAFGEG